MTTATATAVENDGDEGAAAPLPDDRGRSALDRLRRVPLWGHLLAFALLLACVAPIVHAGPAFTTDEGAYGLQQRAIHDTGSFAFDWKGTGVDPTYRWYPIVNGSVAQRGAFPYVAHPAYPLLLRASTAVAGESVGLLLVPLIGALLAAATAWWLAEEVDRRLAPLAFWLAALGPLFVNAWIIWAHAPGAALAGLSLVAALRAGRRGMPSIAFGGAVLATVAGSLVRSENLIFAAGAALAFVIVRRVRVSTIRAAVESAVLVVAAAGTAFWEVRWRSSITGVQDAVSGIRHTTDGSFLSGRLSGMYHSLLLPDAGRQFDFLVIVLSAVLAALVVMTCRRRSVGASDPLRLATGVAAMASAGLLAVVVASSPTRTVTGLVAAWPVVLLAGGALVGPMNRSTRALAAATAVLVAGVLATQYAEGGGLEWGGRFFSPAAAPLAVLAALGIVKVVGPAGARWRAIVAGGVTALVAVSAVAGVVVLHARHVTVAAIDREVLGHHPSVVVTSSEAIPRNAWRSHRDVVWYLVPPEEVADALTRLRSAGVDEVELVEPALSADTFTAAGAVAVTPLHAPVIERLAGTVVAVKLR